jgi:hypothetical protein
MKKTKSSWKCIPIVHQNWFGFDIPQVFKKYNVQTYLGDTTVNDIEDNVWALFLSNNPDRTKGHKDVLMFYVSSNKKYPSFINGRDKKEIKKDLIINGIYCINCNKAYYSVTRHDMHYCECGKIAIDGGRDYLKITGNMEDYKTCSINLLTQKVKLDE